MHTDDDLNPVSRPGLKERLQHAPAVLAPGVYDALTASLAEAAGFEALYLSGAAIAYTKLGRPDIGLVSSSEVEDTLARICERVSTPVIVDADTGFGNALNTQRTMRVFERAGAAAIQLEDQTYPKRCGHLTGKTLVPASEMAGKVRAACDARRNASTLVIARTDAIAVEGFDAAIERAGLYLESGADVLFVEAPRDQAQLERIAASLRDQAPLLANMVEGGDTPVLSAKELGAMGFRIVIFPGGIVRMLTRAAQEFYGTLAREGTTQSLRNQMHDFTSLNEVLGTRDILALGKSYEGEGV